MQMHRPMLALIILCFEDLDNNLTIEALMSFIQV